MKRKLVYSGTVIEVTRSEDKLWRDKDGTVYALPDEDSSVDKVTRCGIGNLSVPREASINELCSAHDHMYSSPAYQKFHTRAEADAELERQFKQAGHPVLGKIFKFFARVVGRYFWENKNTNN